MCVANNSNKNLHVFALESHCVCQFSLRNIPVLGTEIQRLFKTFTFIRLVKLSLCAGVATAWGVIEDGFKVAKVCC